MQYIVEVLIASDLPCGNFRSLQCAESAYYRVQPGPYEGDSFFLCRRCFNKDHNTYRHGRVRQIDARRQFRHTGLFVERCRYGLLERILAERWVRANDLSRCRGLNAGQGLLQDLCMESAPPGRLNRARAKIVITQRDAVIAATIIQWLGTNCGTEWLLTAYKQAGYKLDARDVFGESYYYRQHDEWRQVMNSRSPAEHRFAWQSLLRSWPPRVIMFFRNRAAILWKRYKQEQAGYDQEWAETVREYEATHDGKAPSWHGRQARKPTATDLQIERHPIDPDAWQSFAQSHYDGATL